MPVLLSLESLPFVCDTTLKCLRNRLVHANVSFVSAGPVGSSPAPRPVPAPGDPYHELHALLQRILGITMALQRYPATHVVCILDGWTPPLPSPHPALARLSLAIATAALAHTGITDHTMIYFRGDVHESYERSLDAAASGTDNFEMDMQVTGWTTTLGETMQVQHRLDALVGGGVNVAPFPLRACHLIHAPLFSQENPVASLHTAQKALFVLYSHGFPKHRCLPNPVDQL